MLEILKKIRNKILILLSVAVAACTAFGIFFVADFFNDKLSDEETSTSVAYAASSDLYIAFYCPKLYDGDTATITDVYYEFYSGGTSTEDLAGTKTSGSYTRVAYGSKSSVAGTKGTTFSVSTGFSWDNSTHTLTNGSNTYTYSGTVTDSNPAKVFMLAAAKDSNNIWYFFCNNTDRLVHWQNTSSGYFDSTTQIQPSAVREIDSKYCVSPNSQNSSYCTLMSADSSLCTATITVQDSNSNKISGASVSATVSGTTYSGTAGSDGTCTLYLPRTTSSDTTNITVSKSGYNNGSVSISRYLASYTSSFTTSATVTLQSSLSLTAPSSTNECTYGTAGEVGAFTATGTVSKWEIKSATRKNNGSGTPVTDSTSYVDYFKLSSGTLSTTASTPAGTYTVTVQVTDGTTTKTAGVTVTVKSNLSLSATNTTISGTYGTTAASTTLTVSGGQSTYTYSISSIKMTKDGYDTAVSYTDSATLDSVSYTFAGYFTLTGNTLSTKTGELKSKTHEVNKKETKYYDTSENTPAGTYTVTVKVTDADGSAATVDVTVTVARITTATNGSGVIKSSTSRTQNDNDWYSDLWVSYNPGNASSITFQYVGTASDGTNYDNKTTFTSTTTIGEGKEGLYTISAIIPATNNATSYETNTSHNLESTLVWIGGALSVTAGTVSEATYATAAAVCTFTTTNGSPSGHAYSVALSSSTNSSVTTSNVTTYFTFGTMSSTTASSTNTLSTTATTPAGTYNLTITVTDSAGAKAGEATITVTVKACAVTPTVSFASSYVTYSEGTTSYTQEPVVTVTLNGTTKTLTKSTDYTVAYTNNTEPGIATATVTLKGNYSGSGSGTFGINYTSTSTESGPRMKTVLKFWVPDGCSTAASEWDMDVKVYKSVADYYTGSYISNSFTKTTQSAYINGSWNNYYIYVLGTYTPSSVYTSCHTNYGENVPYVFVVATFTQNTGTKEGTKVTFAGYVYHLTTTYTTSTNYSWAVEGKANNTVGKTVSDGSAGTTTIPSLAFTVGSVSSSLVYGKEAAICTLTTDFADDTKTYTYTCDDKTLKIETIDKQVYLYTTAATTAGKHTVTVTLTDSDNSRVTEDVTFTVNKLVVNDGENGFTLTNEQIAELTPATTNEDGGTVAGNAAEKAKEWLGDGDSTKSGQGFVVWDWTGFEYINGGYVGISGAKPKATLYVNLNGTVETVELTVTASASSGVYTATATGANYDISKVGGVNIGRVTSTDVNQDGTKTLAEIARTEEYSLANTAITAGSCVTATHTYTVVASQQELDKKVIEEKIIALYNEVAKKNSTSSTSAGGGQEFYNNEYNNETNGTAISGIRTLIDRYNETYKLTAFDGTHNEAFTNIEAANDFATATDDSTTDNYEGAKAALDIYNTATENGGDLATYFENLLKDEDGNDLLAAANETLEAALTAYNALGATTKVYLLDEYNALTEERKACATELLNRMMCTVDEGAELTETQTAINTKIEDWKAMINGGKLSDGTTETGLTYNSTDNANNNANITGMLESMKNQKTAALALEGTKRTASSETETEVNNVKTVNAEIDRAIDEVLGLTYETIADKSTDGTVATDLTKKDGLEADVEAIQESCEYICKKIEALQSYCDALTGDSSELTDDEKKAVKELVEAAIGKLTAVDYTTTTKDDDGNSTTAARAYADVEDDVDNIFDDVNTLLKKVQALNGEIVTEKENADENSETVEYVGNVIHQAIDDVLALIKPSSTTDETTGVTTYTLTVNTVKDLATDITNIVGAKDSLKKIVEKLIEEYDGFAEKLEITEGEDEDGNKTYTYALNGSTVLTSDQVKAIKDQILAQIEGVSELDNYDGKDGNSKGVIDISTATGNATDNITALAETFLNITEKESEIAAEDLTENVKAVLKNAYAQAYKVGVAYATTDGEGNATTTAVSTGTYQKNTDIATALEAIQVNTLGGGSTTEDETDDTMGTVDAIIALENCREEVEGSGSLKEFSEDNYNKMLALVDGEIEKIMGTLTTDGDYTDGTGYLYPLASGYDNSGIEPIVEFAEAKTTAALEFADDAADGSGDVKTVASDAMEKIFAVTETGTEGAVQIDKIKESAALIIKGIENLETVRDTDTKVGASDEKGTDITLTDGSGNTLTDGSGNAITVRTFLADGIAKLVELGKNGYKATDTDSDTTTLTNSVSAVVDELSQKAKAIYDLENDKKTTTTGEGGTETTKDRSSNVQAELERAKAAVYGLSYDYSNNTLAADIAAVEKVATSKCECIEALEKLIAQVESSALTESEQKTLKESLNDGLDIIYNKKYPASATATENAADDTIEAIESIVENLTAKTKAATETAAKRRTVTGENDDNADVYINSAIASAIEAILDVSDSANETDTTEKTACESLQTSVNAVIAGIEKLETVRDTDTKVGANDNEGTDITVDSTTSEGTGTTVRTFLENGMKTLVELEYDKDTSVSTTEINAVVDELSQKAKAIYDLENEKIKDGTERSENVCNELDSAKAAVYALNYIDSNSTTGAHVSDYAAETVAEEIADITAFAETKITQIEALEALIKTVEDSALSDTDKATLKAKLTDTTDGSVTSGTELIMAYEYSTDDDKNTANEEAIQNIVENLTALVTAATELANGTGTAGTDDYVEGYTAGSADVDGAIDTAVEKLFALTDDLAKDTTVVDKCGVIETSVQSVIKGIEQLEAKRKEINDDTQVSDETDEERTAAINKGITTLKGLSYKGDSAVDRNEIDWVVGELIQKSDAIVSLDKSRLKTDESGNVLTNDDGTLKTRSENVLAEIKSAIAAVNALDYTDSTTGLHVGTYSDDKESTVAADIKQITDYAVDGTEVTVDGENVSKVWAIEALEALIAKTEANANLKTDTSDDEKGTLKTALETALNTVIDKTYASYSDNTTAIANIVENLTAKTNTALDIVNGRAEEGNSEAVNAEYDKALDYTLGLSDNIEGSPEAGVKAKAELLEELCTLKVEGIKVLEERKKTEATEADLSEETIEKLEDRFDKAIEDVGNISYESSVNTLGYLTEEEMKTEIAKYPSADEEKIIVALKYVDALLTDDEGVARSESIAEEIQEALDKLHALDSDEVNSSGDDLTADIANIEASIEKIIADMEKLEELEKKVEDGNLSEATDKVLADVLSQAEADIKALEYDEEKNNYLLDVTADNIAALAERKVEAAKEADGQKTAEDEDGNTYTRSKDAIEIVDKCVKSLAAIELTTTDGAITDDSTESNKISEILVQLGKDIKKQDEKDAGKAELDKYCSDNEISLTEDTRISGKLKEVKQRIQDLEKGDTESDEDFEARVAEVVAQGKLELRAVEFRYDNHVTEKSNNNITESDVALINAAKEEYDSLTDGEKAEVDKLYQTAYGTFDELVDTKLFAEEFNARKDEIVEELEGKRKQHDGLRLKEIITEQEELIKAVGLEGVGLPERALTEEEQTAEMANLEDKRLEALEEVKLAQTVQQTESKLNNELNELIASGCYSEEGIAELEKIYAEAADKLEDVVRADGWEDEISDNKTEAETKFAGVEVISLATDGVTPADAGDTLDYAEDYDVEENGYIGTVSNSLGMDSSITLVIKKTEDKQETQAAINNAAKNNSAVAAEGSNLTAEDIETALADKEIKVTLDAYLLQNGERVENFDGSYTVKVLIPTELRNVNYLQVVYVNDDGTVEVYDTKVEGNYLIFTTSRFSDFQILGEKTVNLLWVAILLTAVVVGEIAAAIAIEIERKRNAEEKEGE